MEEASNPICEAQRHDLQQRLVDNFHALLFHREVSCRYTAVITAMPEGFGIDTATEHLCLTSTLKCSCLHNLQQHPTCSSAGT